MEGIPYIKPSITFERLFQVFFNLALFLHLVLTSLVLHHSIPEPSRL